jgi:hypothetical protein
MDGHGVVFIWETSNFSKVQGINRLREGAAVYVASCSKTAKCTTFGCPEGKDQGWLESQANVWIVTPRCGKRAVSG